MFLAKWRTDWKQPLENNNNPKFIFKRGQKQGGGVSRGKKNQALVVSGNELNGSGEISAEDGLRRRHLLRKFNIKA